MMHYVWLYDGPQWKQKAMAAAVVAGIFAVVLFPLWPMIMRQGVWYLSVGMMGLLGLFFAMAIFRLILFCITVFTVPPGLWLFPNLFEDVGFFDSFKPLWGWQEVRISLLTFSEIVKLTVQPNRRKRAKRLANPRPQPLPPPQLPRLLQLLPQKTPPQQPQHPLSQLLPHPQSHRDEF